jgi:hypothetical protein
VREPSYVKYDRSVGRSAFGLNINDGAFAPSIVGIFCNLRTESGKTSVQQGQPCQRPMLTRDALKAVEEPSRGLGPSLEEHRDDQEGRRAHLVDELYLQRELRNHR